jgi:hypothetical protein
LAGTDGISTGATAGAAITPPQPQEPTTGMPQYPTDVPQQETEVQQDWQPQDHPQS